MAIVSVNPGPIRPRSPSTLENIAMGVDVAAKILGTGIDAYKTFGIERPKQKLLEETARAEAEAAKVKGAREAQIAEESFAEKWIPAAPGAKGAQEISGRPGLYTFREKAEDPYLQALKLQLLGGQVEKQRKESEESGKKYTGELAPLNKLPEKSRENGAKELGEVKAHAAVETDAFKAFDDLNATAVGQAMVPGYLGGQSGAYDAAQAKLAASLMMKVPGIRSDADFRNIVVPMLPKPLDSDEEKVRKALSFKEWLRSQRPQAPLLKSVGVDTEKMMERPDPEVEAAKKWIKENPNDPRTPLIKQRLGL